MDLDVPGSPQAELGRRTLSRGRFQDEGQGPQTFQDGGVASRIGAERVPQFGPTAQKGAKATGRYFGHGPVAQPKDPETVRLLGRRQTAHAVRHHHTCTSLTIRRIQSLWKVIMERYVKIKTAHICSHKPVFIVAPVFYLSNITYPFHLII